MLFRCPAHDALFETETDSKPPGKDPSHPRNDKGHSCHPDCPIGQKERKGAASVAGTTRRIA